MTEPLVLRALDRGEAGELRVLLSPDGRREVEIRQSAPPGVVVLHAAELEDVVRALASVVKGFVAQRGRPPKPKATPTRHAARCRRGHDLLAAGAAYVNPRTQFQSCRLCVRLGREARKKKKTSRGAAAAAVMSSSSAGRHPVDAPPPPSSEETP